MTIQVKRLTDEDKKKHRIPSTPVNADGWNVWECLPSKFNWHYDEEEWAYLYQGHVKVKTSGETVEIRAGDFVIFPAGLSCSWEVLEKVVKVYLFR